MWLLCCHTLCNISEWFSVNTMKCWQQDFVRFRFLRDFGWVTYVVPRPWLLPGYSRIWMQTFYSLRDKTSDYNLSHKIITHWGRVTHICVTYLTIITSDIGLSPSRRQAMIWTNAGILLTRPLGTNFSEILIEICAFSFKKMDLQMSFVKRRPFCLGLNVLNHNVKKSKLKQPNVLNGILAAL